MLCRNCAAATPTMMMTLRKTWTTQCWATSSSNRAKRSSVVANCAPVAPSIRLAGAELAALSTASGPNQTRKSRGQFFVTGGGGRIVCLGSYLHGHAAADLVGGVRARVLLADDHGCEREESARGRCGCDRGREYLYDRSFHGVASCRQAKGKPRRRLRNTDFPRNDRFRIRFCLQPGASAIEKPPHWQILLTTKPLRWPKNRNRSNLHG